MTADPEAVAMIYMCRYKRCISVEVLLSIAKVKCES
jgi:hypothetical protein